MYEKIIIKKQILNDYPTSEPLAEETLKLLM